MDESLTALRLTPTERRILEALRGTPRRIFNRAELLALAMPGVVVLERTVDVHIRSLRKKLGERHQLIQTVRGVGYRYVPSD